MRILAKMVKINFFRSLKINQRLTIIWEHLLKKNGWNSVSEFFSILTFPRSYSPHSRMIAAITTVKTNSPEAKGVAKHRSSLEAPFSQNCHYLTSQFVSRKTPLTKLSLSDLIWSSSVWEAFFLEVFAKNNYRQLYRLLQMVNKSWSKQ